MSTTTQAETLTRIKSKQMFDLLSSGRRLDGRDLVSYRDIQIETGVIDKAEGSASVSIGDTRVLVGVKVEVGEPYSDSPNSGVLTVNAEFVPLAHKIFEPGPPDENSIELARIVDRGIRESQSVDLEKLVIVPGRLVYIVFVDIYILNHGGNLVDAAGFAAIAALMGAKVPNYEVNEKGDPVKVEGYSNMPMQDCPIPTTVVKINNTLLVDPDLDEENMSEAKILITLTKDEKVCAIQKSGMETFTVQEIVQAQKIAKEKADENRRKFFKEWC